jgi:hypothetical protein
LERGRNLTIAGKAHWVKFKYENLPVFCFNCGRIVHGENGCPARIRPDNKKEWGVWLRAEKPKKQGLNSSAGRRVPGFPEGRFSGKSQSSGGIPSETDSTEFWGNPKTNQQPFKVSKLNNPNQFQLLPKIGVGEFIAGNNGEIESKGKERITGDSKGKENLSKERGKAAQLEEKGEPVLTKWAQTNGAQLEEMGELGLIKGAQTNGVLTMDQISVSWPNVAMRAQNVKRPIHQFSSLLGDEVFETGLNFDEIPDESPVGGLSNEGLAYGDVQMKIFNAPNSNTVESERIFSLTQGEPVENLKAKEASQFVEGVVQGKKTVDLRENKSEKNSVQQGKTATVGEGKYEGKGEEQTCQERKKKICKGLEEGNT